jgi:ABC-2 type transport system ATP-binding protein
MTSPLSIDLHDVRKTYRGKVTALRGINMQVGRGEVFGLLGPNGAGKSTLVKIIMTVIRPSHAVGTVLGNAVGHKPTLARVGYLPEHHRFPRYLSGRQSLDFFGALSKVPRAARRRRADMLIETVGMKDAADRKVGTYSKGMMQRIGLAASMINDPDLILLDEPTDGVDPVGRRDIRDVLLQLKSQGKTVFINSHLLSELEMVCDRVAILVGGAVAKQGTINDLALGRGFYELQVVAIPPPGTPGGGQGEGIGANHFESRLKQMFPQATVGGDIIRVGTTDPLAVQPIVDQLRAANIAVRRMQLIKPTLEELFMEAVQAQQGVGANR